MYKISYTVGFKLNVVKYVTGEDNRAAKRHFSSPPTKNMKHEHRWREEELHKSEANKVKFSLEQAMQAQRGSRGIALLFL